MIRFLLSAILVASSAFAAEQTRVSADSALPKVKAKQAIVIDVREPDELKTGKVAEAQTFPSSKLNTPEFEKFLASLPKDKEIYTYCQRGGRADKVADALRLRGYKARSSGGFQDWVKAGAKTN